MRACYCDQACVGSVIAVRVWPLTRWCHRHRCDGVGGVAVGTVALVFPCDAAKRHDNDDDDDDDGGGGDGDGDDGDDDESRAPQVATAPMR